MTTMSVAGEEAKWDVPNEKPIQLHTNKKDSDLVVIISGNILSCYVGVACSMIIRK